MIGIICLSICFDHQLLMRGVGNKLIKFKCDGDRYVKAVVQKISVEGNILSVS